MPVFKHEPVSFPPLEQKNLPEGRCYITPEGNSYPSITTILASRPKPALDNWKQRVGEKEAAKICRQSASGGTELHDALELHLLNKKSNKISPDIRPGVNTLKSFLDNNVDIVYALECSVYSDILKAAGTCDFFGVMRDVPVVGDYKSMRTPKKREWITDYFIQATFYSFAIWELTGIFPRAVIIMMTTPGGERRVYWERPKEWIGQTKKLIDDFHTGEHI